MVTKGTIYQVKRARSGHKAIKIACSVVNDRHLQAIVVEIVGLEPMTYALRTHRSTN